MLIPVVGFHKGLYSVTSSAFRRQADNWNASTGCGHVSRIRLGAGIRSVCQISAHFQVTNPIVLLNWRIISGILHRLGQGCASQREAFRHNRRVHCGRVDLRVIAAIEVCFFCRCESSDDLSKRRGTDLYRCGLRSPMTATHPRQQVYFDGSQARGWDRGGKADPWGGGGCPIRAPAICRPYGVSCPVFSLISSSPVIPRA
jgi:hypothetical protein